MDKSIHNNPSLKQLYPSLSPEEIRVAQANVDRYLRLILRICKRVESAEQLRHNQGKDHIPT